MKRPSKAPQGDRLQKVLARAGVSSRRDAEKLISAGRVKVDGKVVTTLGTRVSAEARVEVDGREVQAQAPLVIVMNKPDGVVSTTESAVDERGRPTVVSLMRGVSTRLVPVGRLDYHTRGVLLLTNDGKLAAALSHPRREVPKTYHAKFQGKLPESAIEQLHSGVTLEDGTTTRPALEVEVVKATTTNTWVQITIGQGLYRQVRRMGDAIGHSVLKMIRVAYGGITATGLRDGEWRILRDDEIEHLRRVALGKAVCPAPAPTERVWPGRRGAEESAAAAKRVASEQPRKPATPVAALRKPAAAGARKPASAGAHKPAAAGAHKPAAAGAHKPAAAGAHKPAAADARKAASAGARKPASAGARKPTSAGARESASDRRPAPADRPAIARPRPPGRSAATTGARKAPTASNRGKRGAARPATGGKRARRP